jgi:AcrR family transcriptional regulator
VQRRNDEAASVPDSPRLLALLDVAANLFFDRGYASTSMQDIADAAGLHKSTLYHHIDAKADLLEWICGTTLDALYTSLDTAVATRTDPSERVVAAFAGAASVALDDVRGVSVLLHLKETVAGGEELWARRREYDRRFAELIHDAQQAKQVRDDIDALLLGRLVLGMINWVVEWYRPGEGRFDATEIARSLTAFVAQGVRPAHAG